MNKREQRINQKKL